MKYDPAIALFNELTIGHKVPCTLSYSEDVYSMFVHTKGLGQSRIQLVMNAIELRGIGYEINEGFISVLG